MWFYGRILGLQVGLRLEIRPVGDNCATLQTARS
jgi:hypothetical protein